MSGLKNIKHNTTNPGTGSFPSYHHHILLVISLTIILDMRKVRGFRTTLHKV
jgi:hypothetical protein